MTGDVCVSLTRSTQSPPQVVPGPWPSGPTVVDVIVGVPWPPARLLVSTWSSGTSPSLQTPAELHPP
eukprot:scaffold1102_cov256-Pinguiococcus_pyrenoidosus.AAC.39